jgi:hypothetical protein
MVDTIIKGKLGTYIHAPNLQRLDLKFLKGRDAWSPNCFDTAFCGFFSSKPHLKEVHMKGVELTDSMIEQLGRCKSLCHWRAHKGYGTKVLRKVYHLLISKSRDLFPSLTGLDMQTISKVDQPDLRDETTYIHSREEVHTMRRIDRVASGYGFQYQFQVIGGSHQPWAITPGPLFADSHA